MKLQPTTIVLIIATLSDSLSHSEAFSPNALAHNLHKFTLQFLAIEEYAQEKFHHKDHLLQDLAYRVQ